MESQQNNFSFIFELQVKDHEWNGSLVTMEDWRQNEETEPIASKQINVKFTGSATGNVQLQEGF